MRGWRLALLAVALLPAVGCYQPRRVLTVSSTPGVVEGQQTQVTVSVQNILPVAIIPVSMTFYTMPEPLEYFATRRVVAEVGFLEPLQAATVRHFTSQRRVEAEQRRVGSGWLRTPDTRFLHPRILLPGQAFLETFQFQAYEAYRRLLYCDFHYLRVDSEAVRDRLYVKQQAEPPPANADRYTEAYTQLDLAQFGDPEPSPEHYLLHRPRAAFPQDTRVITKRAPIHVTPRAFSYRKAAARARFAFKGHGYFSAANMWVFGYADGTWLVGPDTTVRLRGHYLDLVQHIETQGAQSLGLSAPRAPDGKLLRLFQQLGYSDPKATGPVARATIPVEALPQLLQHAEALGYTLDAATWKRLDESR